jgi:lipopolysaccharide biosynthesis glycosyltransferase
VAAYSLLRRISADAGTTRFTLFSDALTDSDAALLEQTLRSLSKPFTLELRRVRPSDFAGFPPLNGSWATYYRLHAAKEMEAERFLYVDADTLCDVDVSGLQSLDMGDAPAGWVPEARLAKAVDQDVARRLGGGEDDFYFNAGVMLINVEAWRKQKVSETAMDFIAAHRPVFHDQSALNFVLHAKAIRLDARFNTIANVRRNWPVLGRSRGKMDCLIHFLDYPKPWDFLGEWVNPFYRLWREVLNQTAMKDFRSWHKTPARKFPRTAKARKEYQKAIKDRLLFTAYSRGWLKEVKGISKPL